MTGAQLGGATCKCAVNRDNLDVCGVQKGVYSSVCVTPKGTDEYLRVRSGAHMEFVFARQPGPCQLDCPLVLHVGRIEKSDEDIGVEDYRGHSSRSSSRYPTG